jgi:uncharacterized LabA/DUF88 family protein
MERFAVFVDAASLHAQVAKSLTGQPNRPGVKIQNIDRYAAAIKEWACSIVELPLLRVYWFDGKVNGNELGKLDSVPGVKLRLGRLAPDPKNPHKRIQKGVDALVYTHLAGLAANGSISTAVLITGDGDFVEIVDQVQELGVRVELGVINERDDCILSELKGLVDAIHTIPMDALKPWIFVTEPKVAVAPKAPEVLMVTDAPGAVEQPRVDGTSPTTTSSSLVDQELPAAVAAIVDLQHAQLHRPPKDAPCDLAAEREQLETLKAAAYEFGRRSWRLLERGVAKDVLAAAPNVPSANNGEMMVKCSCSVGAPLSTDLMKLLRKAWWAGFKGENEA